MVFQTRHSLGIEGVAVHVARRRLIQAGAAGVAALALPWAAAQTAASDLSRTSLRVASYKGGWVTLLKAAGLGATPYRIDWKEFNSGVQHIEAINADALDLGSGSEIPAVFAARSPGRVRVVAVAKGDLNNQAVFAQKDSPIKTIADLRGKRVGYVRATTTHYFLQKMLAEAGLSFQDIQAISLSPSDGLSAFAGGDFDAWAIYGYNGQLARSKYGARVVKTSLGYLSGNFLTYANADAVADPLRRAALADLLQRLQKATAWGVAHPEQWAQAQSTETRVPAQALLELFRGRSHDDRILAVADTDIASHQEVANVFAQIGVLDGPVKVAPLWDRTFDKALRG
ncbi:ABC transporter substrate-binding protein [Polaromonas hydrogenivorans]|uniref:ABC transporter substrate-binding protein n=1 Tax=Polaromonas hydrogenivorans TaxID=335476 RepID=A0AAU7LN24_9BURK